LRPESRYLYLALVIHTEMMEETMSNEIENTTSEAMPEKWVNLEDIADHLSVSTDTVRNWIKDGKLPFYKAGKRYKFKISEVDAWLRDGKISD
jgi:excisionase family DNA binding protein